MARLPEINPAADTTPARRRLLLVLGLLLLAASAPAQSPTGSAVHGTVINRDGLPEPGMVVLIHNADTAFERLVRTGPDGTFLCPNLPSGNYVIRAAGPRYILGRAAYLTLALGETAELQLPLGIAAVIARIEVIAEPQTSPLDLLIDPAQLQLLPVNNRRWQSVALLAPGAVPDEDGDGLLSFRGLASTQNSLVLDGMDANQSFSSVPAGTGSDPVPDPDDDEQSSSSGTSTNSSGLARGRGNGASTGFSSASVREFRVTGQSYSALTGHAAGGTVTAVTRSGGSELHGSAFTLLRSSAFAATNPLSIASTYADGIVSSGLVKPRDLRYNYGGTVGGPLTPKHRAFYFGSFEGQHRDFPAIASPTYATFFALTPTQSALLATRGVTKAATAAALTYLSSLTGEVPRTFAESIAFAKLDWQLTARHSLGLQYNRLRSQSPAGVTSAPTVPRGRASLGDSAVSIDSFIPRITSTFGPHIANDLRLQAGRDLQHQRPQPSLPQEPAIGPGGQAPEVNVGPNGFLFGTPASLSRQAYPDERREEASDTITLSLGHHLLQIGADISLIHDRVATLPNAAGTFHYDSSLINGHAGGLVDWITDYTFGVNAYPNGACPSINAKVHLFCFRSFTQSFGTQTVAFDTQEWAGFVQDQWRPTRTLTLDLGVRYEYELLPFPQQPNPALDAIFGTRASTGVFPEDRNNIGPRIGLSWQPSGRRGTVLRLGYGAYYGRLPGATIRAALANTALPLTQQTGSTTHIRLTPSAVTACPQLANQGFGYPCAYVSTPPAAVSATTSATLFDRHFRLPLVQQGSFSIEHSLPGAITFAATYIMNMDRQLPSSTDLNIAPSTTTRRFVVQGGPGPVGVRDGDTFVVPLYTARITPLFGPVTDILSDVNATFHALAINLDRSPSRGLGLRAGYTWSKALDFGQNATGTPRTDAQFDPFTNRYDKAVSALNYPHSLTVSALWQPTYPADSPLVKATVNGWSFAPILTMRSGRPYTFQIFGGTALSGGRESINGSGGATYLPTVGRNTLRLPRAVNLDLRLTRTVPLSRTPDRLRLRLSAEAFNLANHLNYASVQQRAFIVGPAASGLTPLIFQDAKTIAAEGLNVQPFATPTSASTGTARERQVQFGVRIDF